MYSDAIITINKAIAAVKGSNTDNARNNIPASAAAKALNKISPTKNCPMFISYIHFIKSGTDCIDLFNSAPG